jgi:hypothetical protein
MVARPEKNENLKFTMSFINYFYDQEVQDIKTYKVNKFKNNRNKKPAII